MKKTLYQDLWEGAAGMEPAVALRCGDQSLTFAAMRIIDKGFRITKQHGQWFDRAGVQMTAIYHPSAVLRDPLKGPDTFVDLKGIQAKVRELCPDSFSPRPE